MIEAVLFDLDDTLADSRASILSFYRGLFDRLNRPFPADAAAQRLFYTLPHHEIRARFYPEESALPTVAAFMQSRDFDTVVREITLKPGARALLDWCSERMLLVLATNRGPTTARVLEHLDIAGYFQIVHTAETMVRPKPDPWVVTTMIEHLSLAPAAFAFVGDSSYDIRCAKAGGIRSIGVGDNWKDGADAPDYAAADLYEVRDILARLTPEGPGPEVQDPARW